MAGLLGGGSVASHPLCPCVRQVAAAPPCRCTQAELGNTGVVTEGGAVAGWLESQHGMCSELARLSNAASSASVLTKPALRTQKT